MSGLHPIIYSILRSMYISLKLFCEHGKYENENYTKLNHEMKWNEYSLIGSCLLWLSLYYLSHYRAAEFDNMEALIKMAIAYLYNEGCKYTSE